MTLDYINLNEVLTFLKQQFDIRYTGEFKFHYLNIIITLSLMYLFTFKRAKSIKAFFALWFPKDRYTSEDTKVNKILFFYYFVLKTFIYQFFFMVLPSREKLQSILPAAFELSVPTSSPTGITILLVKTLLAFLAIDLGFYVSHWVQHTKYFWPFHKVHHSDESLTPLTGFRVHIIDIILDALFVILFNVVIFSLLVIFTGSIEIMSLLSANVFYFLFRFNVNLIHTHVWVDYGPFLSNLLITPAHHQLHHSLYHKYSINLGFHITLWDKLFGTHYFPKEPQYDLVFGCKDESGNNECHRSFLDAMLKPFKELWALILKSH